MSSQPAQLAPPSQPPHLDAGPEYATQLKALHRPGKPVVFANIYDFSTLAALLSLNDRPAGGGPVRAVATASYAIAETMGVRDAELTMQQNLDRVAQLGPIVRAAKLPLTADLQDGYGDRIAECVRRAVGAGVVGANIEDALPPADYSRGLEGALYAADTQVERIKLALRTAADAGVPDFVVNARTDVFLLPSLSDDQKLEEAIKRGKAYLEAGATTVFVWGGSKRGLRTQEVQALVKAFDGRLAVKLAWGPDALLVQELADIGVARISVGSSLWTMAMSTFKAAATRILEEGKL